jgi:hypothetical protein
MVLVRAGCPFSSRLRMKSIPQLLRVADTNSNLTVRKEAFFWLGRSQDPQALAYLEQALKR